MKILIKTKDEISQVKDKGRLIMMKNNVKKNLFYSVPVYLMANIIGVLLYLFISFIFIAEGNSQSTVTNDLTLSDGSQIINLRIHVAATAPTSPYTGMLYHDTDDNYIYYYNGSAWVRLFNLSSASVGAFPSHVSATQLSGSAAVISGTATVGTSVTSPIFYSTGNGASYGFRAGALNQAVLHELNGGWRATYGLIVEGTSPILQIYNNGQSNGHAILKLTSYSSDISWLIDHYRSTRGLTIYQDSATGRPFSIGNLANGAESLGIDASGKVSLSVTGSGGGLDISGRTLYEDASSRIHTNSSFVSDGNVDSSDGTITARLSRTATSGLVGTQSNHPFDILVNDSIKATFNTSGYLGILTSTPASALNVIGSVTCTGEILAGGAADVGAYQFQTTVGGAMIATTYANHSSADYKTNIRDSKTGELVANPRIQKATPHVRTFLLDKERDKPLLEHYKDVLGVTEIINIKEIPEQILAPEDAWEATQVVQDTTEIAKYEPIFLEVAGKVEETSKPIYVQEAVWQKFRKPEVQFDEKTGVYSIPASQEITRTTKEITIETAKSQYDKALAQWNERNTRPAYNVAQKGFIAQELPPELQAEGGVGWSLNAMIVYQMEKIQELENRLAALEKDKVPNHEERIKGLEGK